MKTIRNLKSAARYFATLTLFASPELSAEEGSIQETVETFWRETKATTGAKSGTVIVMNAATGEVTGLTNPEFAVGKAIEPASLFKPVTAALAIDDGVVTADTVIGCHNGKLEEGSITVFDNPPWDRLSVTKVVSMSSSIGSYEIGKKLGFELFYADLDRLGVGKPTGIRLPGEAPGIIPATRYVLDFSRQTFGYCLTTTPIRITTIYATLANGGKSVTPWMPDAPLSDPPQQQQLLKPETAKVMRTILVASCGEGAAASRAAVDGIPVGGCAARTRLIAEDARVIVSFAGFFEIGNVTYVAVLVLDAPTDRPGGVYGNTVASPAFADRVKRLSGKNEAR